MNEFNTNRTSSKSNYTLHCSPFPKSEVVSRSHGEAGVRRIMKTKQVEFTGIKLSWQTNCWVTFLIRMPNRDRSFSPHSIAALPLTYTFDFYEKLIAHFFATFSSRDNLSKYQRIRKHPSTRRLIKFEFHSLGQLFTRFHPMHRPDNGRPKATQAEPYDWHTLPLSRSCQAVTAVARTNPIKCLPHALVHHAPTIRKFMYHHRTHKHINALRRRGKKVSPNK